jgi:hypothetical protein
MSRSAFLLWSFLDLQLRKLFKDLLAVIAGLHFIVFSDADDVKNFAVLANDESNTV